MWFENLIGFFSPEAKLKRNQARLKDNVLRNNVRSYEAASKGRRTEGWTTPNTSATAEITQVLTTLRNRSRDMVRNNPYAARGVELIPANVVGKGIEPNIWAPAEKEKEQVQNAWRKWANTPTIDFDGRSDFAGLQRLAMRAVVESGEVLIRLRRVKNSKFPIKIQILEPDFLVTNNNFPNVANGNRVVAGIELDDNDQRVAYHLYKSHPGNTTDLNLKSSYETVRVPAADILHVYRTDRPGQIRGVPWLAAVMTRLKDLDGYEDAQLVRQKIAACFSVFVHDIEAAETLTGNNAGALGDSVEPGIIEILPPGKDIKFASPPGPGDEFAPYMSHILHSIASGLGVSYEALTGDLGQVNFSSARMGWLEFQRNIDVWRCMLISNFNDPVFNWFLDSLNLTGINVSEGEVSWVPPRREMIDPGKEVNAKIKAIRAGIETLSDVVRQNGKHPRDHFEELKEDNDTIDELGLVLDSDPRNITVAGQSQIDGAPNA